MQITGTISHVGETQSFGQSNFRKRLIVLDITRGNYTNQHGFEFIQDDVSKLDGLPVGVEATVDAWEPTCREYQGKWYADFPRGKSVVCEQSQEPPKSEQVAAENQAYSEPDEADIPF